jgi:hypothetical protein
MMHCQSALHLHGVKTIIPAHCQPAQLMSYWIFFPESLVGDEAVSASHEPTIHQP